MNGEKLFRLAGATFSLVIFGVLVWRENRRPLRRSVEPALNREGRNLAVAGAAAVALQLTEVPAANRLTKLVEQKNWGLLKILPLPPLLETILAVALMDYTLYVWHYLTHRVPFLWRFHLIHHIDLDLDATTAVRFHFVEIIVSVAWRSAQILLIGVSPTSFAAWQMFLFPSILFHHSNIRLPLEFERKLQKFVVTPRLHGIHHSAAREETDSNWSSGLTLWDRLHGTYRADVPEDKITIGVPAYQNPGELTLPKILWLPFKAQRTSWQPAEAGKQLQ